MYSEEPDARPTPLPRSKVRDGPLPRRVRAARRIGSRWAGAKTGPVRHPRCPPALPRCGPQSARGYRAPPHGGHRRRSTARKPGQPLQAPARGRQRGSARLQARVAASGLPETLGPKLVPLVQPRGSRRAARAQRRRRLRLPRRSRRPRSGVAESSRDPDSRLRPKPGGSPGVHRAWATRSPRSTRACPPVRPRRPKRP